MVLQIESSREQSEAGISGQSKACAYFELKYSNHALTEPSHSHAPEDKI
jgi:hypothetical protein